MQNQIQKRSHEDMIRTAIPAHALPPGLQIGSLISANSPNYIGHNETVNERKMRRAGCYVIATGKFILDGESDRVVTNVRGTRLTAVHRCNDGTLTTSTT